MLVINSAANFYIYIIFYRRFRNNLAKILGCSMVETKKSISERTTGTSVTMVTTMATNVSSGDEAMSKL